MCGVGRPKNQSLLCHESKTRWLDFFENGGSLNISKKYKRKKSFLCEGDEEDSRNVDSVGHTQWADRSGAGSHKGV